MYAKSLRKFNSFEATKMQWPATCVLLPIATRSRLQHRPPERGWKQLRGRQGDGLSFKEANKFIEDELRWTSCECRQAKSKTLYFARARKMPAHRRSKAILDAMDATNNYSKAYMRMQKLCELYGCEAMCTHFVAEDRYSWSSL